MVATQRDRFSTNRDQEATLMPEDTLHATTTAAGKAVP